MAFATASTIRGSQPKSGKPWPRFTAPFSAASALMTVKMVVPTFGRREGNEGLMGVSCGAFMALFGETGEWAKASFETGEA
jgi:hypothetical protein